MNRWLSGLLAGFAAAALVLLPGAIVGGAPAVVDEVGWIADWLGTPRPLAWLVLVAGGGSLCGLAIAALGERKRGISGVRKGIAVGVVAWIVQALWIWPQTAAGFLGTTLGWAAPIVTLAGHVAFGVLLGAIYGALRLPRRGSIASGRRSPVE